MSLRSGEKPVLQPHTYICVCHMRRRIHMRGSYEEEDTHGNMSLACVGWFVEVGFEFSRSCSTLRMRLMGVL